MEINTLNRYAVGKRGKQVVILMPPRELSCDEALVFAAYLVSMAEMDTETKFADVLDAVQNT
jgi:hypothetical protein